MKILIPITQLNNIYQNPFVDVISSGLISLGNEVVRSREEFWNNPFIYDLILFQWPETIINFKDQSLIDVDIIEKHLQRIKEQNVPMVITVHNLHPHDNNEYKTQLYNIIYDYVDVFHHMGNYSYKLMKEKYPHAHHFIVPHPTYFDDVEILLSQKECRSKYGLPHNKTVVLAFGAFRNKEERKMLLDLCHKFYFDCCIWAPKFNRTEGIKRSKISRWFTFFCYRVAGVHMQRGPISNSDVMEMIKAADIFFIQRKEILNSGNLPLGFSAGKIVVGPDMGNVGEILRATGNPVFNPTDINSIRGSLKSAIMMYEKGADLGQKNYDFAKNNWNKNRVAQLLNEEIQKIVPK